MRLGRQQGYRSGRELSFTTPTTFRLSYVFEHLRRKIAQPTFVQYCGLAEFTIP